MSPSVRRIWLAILTIVVAIIVLRTLTENKEQSQTSSPDKQHESAAVEAIDVSTKRVSSTHHQTPPERRRAQTQRTSGVVELPSAPVNLTPPVTGFIVDLYDHWTTIPAGYVADGVVLKNGAITLDDSAGTTGPRDGLLISPPLPLRQPAMAGPVEQSITLPEGSGVQMQISLSEDGTRWSPWLMVERYAPPDGKRIVPTMQAMLANENLALLDSQSSSSKAAQNPSGPSVRYRLGLSATGNAPVVSDLRLWKRETP